MHLGGHSLVVALMLASAVAGAAPVPAPAPAIPDPVAETDPVAPASPARNKADPALLILQPAPLRLYNALESDASDEDIDMLVAGTATELDMNCPRVTEYQVYRTSARSRTLKIKCEERPVYAITVGMSGEAFVSGGDGTIGQMRLADGPIKTMFGERVEDYIAHARRERPMDRPTGADSAAVNDRSSLPGGRELLMWFIWAAAVAAAVWMAASVVRMRRRLRTTLSRWRDLSTEAKDQIVEESEEIYPDLYRHPDGIYIARGQRGKRRLFSGLVFAYLYSRQGIKLFEIR